MADDILEEFIRQYIHAQAGPQVIFAWQGGEPTLRGLHFFERAVALERHYLPLGWTCENVLQTNGILLDDDWCSFLREYCFLVGISIDGPAPLHNRYRLDSGGHPTHHRAMRALKLLQARRIEHNVLCVVNGVNAKYPLEVYQFFKDHRVTWIQFIPLVEHLGCGRVSGRSVAPDAFADFMIAIFDEWRRRDVGRVFIQLFEECLRVWSGLPPTLCVLNETCGRALVLEHNGDLFSCDHFVDGAHYLGNMKQVPLSVLARSPTQMRFGLDKRDRLAKCCETCDVRFICHGGCPKDRFLPDSSGQRRVNYLCPAYRRIFHHVAPYMRRAARLLREGRSSDLTADGLGLHALGHSTTVS